ncbi:hypothetical protein AB1K84_02515 [Mesobacillus foraminis]|uniref:hypothetical protein n=1 Tax=Mesobacillus foraminis TaxID=279826 RepID=UPI0039A08CF6
MAFNLILLSNYPLYHTQFYNPIPKGAVLGSLFDFIIIIPLLTYFIIIRKRYSLKYLGAIIFVGFASAYVPERFSRKELHEIYDARVPDMISGKPQFEILLHEPHTLHMLYG